MFLHCCISTFPQGKYDFWWLRTDNIGDLEIGPLKWDLYSQIADFRRFLESGELPNILEHFLHTFLEQIKNVSLSFYFVWTVLLISGVSHSNSMINALRVSTLDVNTRKAHTWYILHFALIFANRWITISIQAIW